MSKIGRNDPCPCGSGRKYKRCCLRKSVAATGFTAAGRDSALSKLARFVAAELEPDLEEAREEFYGRWLERLTELEHLEPYWIAASGLAFNMWFYFDYRFDGGERVVDVVLEEGETLTAGERRYLEQLRGTAMRLYEVEDLSPGVSLTVRDVLSGTRMTVREKLGSRSMERNTLLAARIVERGVSGQPEIEAGLLHFPELIKRHVVSQLSSHRDTYRHEYPEDDELEFFKYAGPFFHDAWISCVLEPPVPSLQNTDGEDMLLTRVRFDVSDPEGLETALDGRRELEREEEGETAWSWPGTNRNGEAILLGRLVLKGSSLELECNSAERGGRGRAMIEVLAGETVCHRSTTHESMERKLREQLRAGGAHVSGGSAIPSEGPEAVPRDVLEALTLDHLARHYRKWLDEPIPALDDRTPRQAAGDPALRPKVVDLIRGLEGMYQRALKAGEPAYDPSWMWSELGLDDRAKAAHPPPLAHERMASMVPGIGELCRTVADHIRKQTGFDDASTVLTAEETGTNLEVQRFLRKQEGLPPGGLAAHVDFLINYELHRRKTFWVDEALAFMLAKTDTDVPGSDLRVPFPCFALVFADRHVLSLAERLLAEDRQCPLAGHFLRVATVYVTEEHRGTGRVLRLGFALDAMGADPPHLVVHEIPVADDLQLGRFLDSVAPPVIADPPVADWHPLRGLLQATLNSVLYATSAGVAPELRRAAGRRRPVAADAVFTSEEVFFLPGHIEISQMRGFQQLERLPSGRQILHRFMVRGHWRRPKAKWKDPHLRWIEPYWKGPDIAAIIERTYKLTP